MKSTNYIKITLIFSLLVVSPAMAKSLGQRPHPKPVRDLHYGKALYDFYQSRYFRAITDITAAQARSPITRQGNDPELLLGSMYLSYGLHDAASDIFERLLSGQADPYTHDLAWFYLGRMRYMDGQYIDSLKAFNSILGALPDDKNAERVHLMVNAYLHENNYSKAIDTLKNYHAEGIWNDYARYNLGTTLIRTGRVKQGIEQLERLNQIHPGNEEEYVLRDKANVAIGYTAMQQDLKLNPVTSFSRVRLKGPITNQALLGMGWAYNLNNQPQQALKSWMALSSSADTGMTSEEALIAIAFTLEQLKQRKLALGYYEKAVQKYDQVREKIDESISGVNFGDLLKKSIPSSFAPEDTWSTTGIKLTSLPAADFLSEALNSRSFQKAYRDYLDLNYIRLQIIKWNEKIPQLETMLEERRRLYTLNIAHAKDLHYADRIEVLFNKRAKLAAELAAIEGNGKFHQLETTEEHDRLKELQDIKTKLDSIAKRGLDVGAEMKEYHILNGLLIWKLETELPIRLWQAKKSMHELDKALALVRRSQKSLENTLKITPLNFNRYSQRITDLGKYLQTLSYKLDNATKRQEQYCALLIIDALQTKKQTIDALRNKALFAKARLIDELSHQSGAP